MSWETILVALFAGFIGALIANLRKSPKADYSLKHIRCESLEMVDASGVPRITMKMLPPGCPMLYITTPEGKPSARLWVSEKGMPQLDLTGGGDQARAALLLGEHGEPGLLLSDENGSVRGRFNLDQLDGSHLQLHDAKRKESINLQQSGSGAGITITDKRGINLVLLGSGPPLPSGSSGVTLSINNKDILQGKSARGGLTLLAVDETLALQIDGELIYPKRRDEAKGGAMTDE